LQGAGLQKSGSPFLLEFAFTHISIQKINAYSTTARQSLTADATLVDGVLKSPPEAVLDCWRMLAFGLLNPLE
jgi:hypothetical protein